MSQISKRGLLRAGVATTFLGLGPLEGARASVAVPKCEQSGTAEIGATPCVDDDCQIIALLGRALLSWGKAPPAQSQFSIFYRPEQGHYVEQCPWTAMGVAAPPPNKPDLDNRQFFTEPVYSDGGRTAQVELVTRQVGREVRGLRQSPFVRQVHLTLKKRDGVWTLVSKELRLTT